MRVLVVDDQSDACLALTDLLGALGVGAAYPGGVDSADDGDTALAMIERAKQNGRPYDLLLIDWVMPRLNGEDTLKALAVRTPGKAPVPVIVSAYDSEIMHSKAEELGARHFLPKPVLPESLRDLVRWLAGSEAAGATPARPATTTDDLADLQVLVVEDNAINQQLAVELLESRHAKVDVASNGQEAIERVNAHPPTYYSVVLMDLQMPVMDGYEATRLLRLDSRYVNLPIVAMTAHAMADERARCQVLGMNGHISKPIDPDALYATLAGFRHAGAAPRPGPTTSPAARAAPEADADPTTLPEIAGLDVHAGLHHAGGKAALYAQLLRHFAHDYADFAGPVASMLAEGRWEEATRQAHTLKGLAASLGATEVRPWAAALENAARIHDGADARSNLARTAECLALLVSALRAHFAGEDGAALRPGTSRAIDAAPAGAAPAAASDWLARLRELLLEGDVEARELWESRQAEIAARLPAHVMQRIAIALENFDFDAALELLPDSSADRRPGPDSGAAA
jgi:CheY-like chemotaxis protein